MKTISVTFMRAIKSLLLGTRGLKILLLCWTNPCPVTSDPAQYPYSCKDLCQKAVSQHSEGESVVLISINPATGSWRKNMQLQQVCNLEFVQ